MSGCVNIALRDILAGSVAGGYEGQPLKAGGAAQPGGCSACFVPVGCRGLVEPCLKGVCFGHGNGSCLEGMERRVIVWRWYKNLGKRGATVRFCC